MKPAHEPIVVARKPFAGTVAGNVLEHGTGALNIDGCRIGFASDEDRQSAQALAELRAKGRRLGVLGEPGQGNSLAVADSGDTRTGHESVSTHKAGRWPANVVLDPEAAHLLDQQSGPLHTQDPATRNSGNKPNWSPSGTDAGRADVSNPNGGHWEKGTGASRFFYCAKASRNDRGTGNTHPTVKPVDLMRWLVRLVTPPDGTVLDPFAGSGSTLIAATIEGRRSIGIEPEPDYLDIIRHRLTQPIAPVLDLDGGTA